LEKGFIFLKRGSFYANNCRKFHSTEEFRRWIKVGDYKGRKIGVVKRMDEVTSHQLPVTRRIRQMNQNIKKGGRRIPV